jgi:hypothetical protein
MEWKRPKPKNYRERAVECRKLAKLAPADLRNSYLALADSYELLAREAEGRSEGMGPLGR